MLISWDELLYFAVPTILLVLLGGWAAYKERRGVAWGLYMAGLVVYAAYIGLMWHGLERPPMRTMGETRLWYSFFALVAGAIVYLRWRFRWILGFAAILASVFLLINLLKPEIHNKSMMPALESIYFVPHVVAYMFSYAMLGAALLVTLYILLQRRKARKVADASLGVNALRTQEVTLMRVSDNMVYTGLAFLMVGLLLGAFWAKQAWGHYWSWDPKETWAAITLVSYWVYIHFRRQSPQAIGTALGLLILSFLLLQICWYGVNYLPSAQGVSVHTYGF